MLLDYNFNKPVESYPTGTKSKVTPEVTLFGGERVKDQFQVTEYKIRKIQASSFSLIQVLLDL